MMYKKVILDLIDSSQNDLDVLKEISQYIQTHPTEFLDSRSNCNIEPSNLPTTTSCINCGAPIDLHKERCPYCGTYYNLMKRRCDNA